MIIVTCNTNCGRRFKEVCAAFQSHPILRSADVIFLQEVEHRTEQDLSQADILGQILGKQVSYTASRPLLRGGSHGLAILSNFPIVQTKVISLPYFHSHINPRTRVAQFCDIIVNNVPVTLVNVHLDLKINISDRMSQTVLILDTLDEFATDRVIMAGDFNTTLFHWYKNTFPVGVVRQHRRFRHFVEARGFTPAKPPVPTTMRLGPLSMVLDHIFVKGLTIEHAHVETSLRISDHYPVWADLSL